MRLFGRRREQEEGQGPALYVHLANDGAILVVRETGEQLWTDRDGLHRELGETAERGGFLLYSREAPDAEPPAHVEETFRQIVAYELPIRLLEEPHPEANAPADARRTILRDEG